MFEKLNRGAGEAVNMLEDVEVVVRRRRTVFEK